MRFFPTVYLLLLIYVLAALIFWGLSLQKQSIRIFDQEQLTLQAQIDSTQTPLQYATRLHELEKKRDTRTKQYLGEGSTFLLVILIGAAVVYTSFKRSLRLSRQQNNFMLSVTHELKSPIAAMKLNLQTLEKHRLEEAQQHQLIGRCVLEADRLNDLCNNMLLASQMEGRQYKPAKERLDFSALAEESMRDYTGRYPGRFDVAIAPDIALMGDKLLLQMAVHNLVENSIKYTPADKPIHISLKESGGVAVFEVADEGTGIADREKKKIFNKFYRVGNEETRKTKGTGLGLYLTARISHQHRGKVTIKDNQPSGAIFQICLPTG